MFEKEEGLSIPPLLPSIQSLFFKKYVYDFMSKISEIPKSIIIIMEFLSNGLTNNN